MTKAEKAPAEQADTTDRVAPIVQVNCLKRNRAGSVFCQWYVMFPKGGLPEDLELPHIWERCQQNSSTAFRQRDEVRVDAFDGSWSADCIVSHASLTEVILAVKTVTKMPPRREHLYEDDLYAVRFVGNGYSVFRKSDDQKMNPDAYANPEVARQRLLEIYPKRVG